MTRKITVLWNVAPLNNFGGFYWQHLQETEAEYCYETLENNQHSTRCHVTEYSIFMSITCNVLKQLLVLYKIAFFLSRCGIFKNNTPAKQPRQNSCRNICYIFLFFIRNKWRQTYYLKRHEISLFSVWTRTRSVHFNAFICGSTYSVSCGHKSVVCCWFLGTVNGKKKKCIRNFLWNIIFLQTASVTFLPYFLWRINIHGELYCEFCIHCLGWFTLHHRLYFVLVHHQQWT